MVAYVEISHYTPSGELRKTLAIWQHPLITERLLAEYVEAYRKQMDFPGRVAEALGYAITPHRAAIYKGAWLQAEWPARVLELGAA